MTQTATVPLEAPKRRLKWFLEKTAELNGKRGPKARYDFICPLIRAINGDDPAVEDDPDYCGLVFLAFAEACIDWVIADSPANSKHLANQARHYQRRGLEALGGKSVCPALDQKVAKLTL
ncbi:MAG: hypothetical protein HYT40_04065 [Candidatus Sungbacteria bacterium]|uniref:Uncharacterized protein n=1 Tax=Candidatus Sungiibacteriota bacterium TaxID=2750080 RepID=A0A931WPZ9_9BACT|nr:hypothetical protein [Candidatus Sungbacteria bacterium]